MKHSFSFTAIIEKSDDGWYVGQIQEVPEALSQGKTINELMENLSDALHLVFETKKERIVKKYSGRKVLKHRLVIAQA
jgi:predicted RNase H-like HicB family nuclease